MKRPKLALALLSGLCLLATTAYAAPPSKAEVARYAEGLLTRRYRTDAPGGAVLIARGDTVLFRAARGEADVDTHAPLRPDSVFRIGSVSKQFAAAGLLKLVEAGKVKLDDPLSIYLPDYPGGERITVLQLLNHTSGVKSYTRIPGYMKGPVRLDLATAQMVDAFKNEAPDFAPGTDWAYSNSGYVLVGAVIEAASGQPWHAYLERALFRPLGMRRTGYAHDPRFAAQAVRGYSYEGDKVVPMRPMSMTQAHAAGGLVSNLDDLLKWNRALHEGRVLTTPAYTRMITPVGAAAQPGIRYGFGLFEGEVRRNQVLQHDGGIFGFISSMSYLPGPDITVVVLENDDQDDDRRGGDSADTVARKLAAMALGEPYPELKEVDVDVAALQAAQGVYSFDGGVTRTLRVVDGKLTAQRGDGKRAALTPIGLDDFLYEDGFHRLQLERGPGGEIRAVRFFANGDGAGEVGARTDAPLPAI